MKDKAIALALKGYWNMKFEKIGKIKKLFFDSEAKRIFLEIDLKGENEPVNIEIVRYHIEKDRFFVDEVKASKEWMEGLFELLASKGIELPPQVAKYLRVLL